MLCIIIMRMANIDDYKVGMTVYGKVSGIKPYGAFVNFEDDITGLIHISEISNGFVKNINTFLNIDDYVMVKIIDIDKQHKQLRLSFKALSQNTSRYTKRVKSLGMPECNKGFGTIRDMMPIWLKEEHND